MSVYLILIASLLGSTHCAAMCGGFVALCSQQPAPLRGQVAYHSGRLVTYLALGFISGLIGSNVNQVGQRFGIAQVATIVTAILLIAVGVSGLLRLRLPWPNSLIFRQIKSLQAKLLPSRTRLILFPFCVGLSSTLLPCGWLYTYVAVAASEAAISASMLVMFIFWIGTLPLLATIGGLSNIVISPLSRFVPILASLLMITAGAFSLHHHLVPHSPHVANHSVQVATPHDSCVDAPRTEQSN